MRRLIAALAALTLCLTVTGTPALATPASGHPTDDPGLATTYAARWIARQVGADGAVAGFTGDPDVGSTVDAALALAATGEGGPAFARAVDYIAANDDGYLVDGDGHDLPGQLGKVVLLAVAAGRDPHAFGGDAPADDLVARIQATRRTSGAETGMYGRGEPNTFAQVTLQSLAILGLTAAGVTPDRTASDWLVDQQCADGGFPAYRTPQARAAGDGCEQTPPDTNTTGLAAQALAAVGRLGRYDLLGWLADVQNPDGGFGFQAADDTDPNSTALAVQAIVAFGDDPQAASWVQDGTDPVAALTTFQLGCDAAPAARGALWAPFSGPDQPNAFATFQGVWGLAQRTLTGVQAPGGDAGTFPDCPLSRQRLAGATRLDTAVAVANASHPDGADTVVVANAYAYADALAGAPLAHALDAPILLTPADTLPDVVARAVDGLGARHVIVLGGTGAVSDAVATQLAARPRVSTVERVAGPTRFDTAAHIAEKLAAIDGHTPARAFVVEGADPDPDRGWPDALAVAALAAQQHAPILLVTTDTLPAPTAARLDGLAAATVVGGTAAVSADVAAKVDDHAGTVDRLAGSDRYATAAAVTDRAVAAGADPVTTWLVTGGAFADALAVGPAATAAGHPVVLVDGQGYDGQGPTADLLRRLDERIDHLVVAGGPGAVTDDTLATVASTVREQAR